MTFEVGEVLTSAIEAVAKEQGVTPQEVVFQVLKERFMAHVPRPVPRNEWERQLLESARDYGGRLPDSACDREELYE